MFRRNKFEDLCKKAQKHIAKQEFESARDLYLECLSLKPNDLGTLNNIAQIHSLLNENDKAKGYNEIVLNECEKQSATMEKEEILIFKINALTSLKRNEEANEYVDELLRISPESTIGLYYKVSYLEEKNQYRQSLKYLDRILLQDPHDIQALLIKGKTLVELDEFKKAERFYNRILEIDSLNRPAITFKSELLKKQFNLTLTPHDLMLKAIDHWEMNDLKTAEDYFKKALSINQKYDEIWFNQGRLLIKMKKITKATQSFEKAFELNPRSGGIVKQKKLFRMLKVMKIINKIFRVKE